MAGELAQSAVRLLADMAEGIEAVSSLRDFEQQELDAGTRSSILDAWGRTLFQNTKSVITRGRSDSGPAVVSTLRDFEQRIYGRRRFDRRLLVDQTDDTLPPEIVQVVEVSLETELPFADSTWVSNNPVN